MEGGIRFVTVDQGLLSKTSEQEITPKKKKKKAKQKQWNTGKGTMTFTQVYLLISKRQITIKKRNIFLGKQRHL